MLNQDIDWDTFCGQVDAVHPKFHVTAHAKLGRIEHTTPNLKGFCGASVGDFHSWYSRHNTIGFRILPTDDYGRALHLNRLGEGRLEVVVRSLWGRGPWDDEPDFRVWNCVSLPCVLGRNGLGAWCGYVGVPSNHPDYESSYAELRDIRVHGRVTCADFEPQIITHVYQAIGESVPIKTYWIGFDCAHSFDAVPVGFLGAIRGDLEDYVTYQKAKDEVEVLVTQLLSRKNDVR